MSVGFHPGRGTLNSKSPAEILWNMHDNTGTEGPASLEHVKKSDVFPKKALVSDDERLRVPFPLLSGESAEFLGRTADGVVVLSNFRLLIRYRDSFINVPLGLIESVEIRDIFYLHVYCKDATAVRCAFSTNETCQDWFKRLSTKTAPRGKLDDVFAFAFHAWCVDRNPSTDPVLEGCYQLCPLEKPAAYNFTEEVERLKFDLRSSWRYTEINKSFGLCSSYPPEHIVPKSVTDEHLKKVAGFRALQRFPSVVWRNCRNGAVLVRCSQPEMGFFGWRNTDDENLLSAIPLACALNGGFDNKLQQQQQDGNSSSSELSSDDSECGMESVEPKKMLVIDCRSYSAAFANRAKGGGVECPEYYPSCEIQFMNLANIHAIRKSFLGLRQLCSGPPDQASWLSVLENTKWLHNMSCLLKTATLVASVNNKEGRPVLVHCSDGWDRTSQIISLAELLLDPYYRTRQGFQVLIEREWLQFGHKFADRCGNGLQSDDQNERCPVFLQWLECVYQLILQFPCQFQFNEAFLVKLVHHTYSCLFGTFLCNTHQERLQQQLVQRTAAVWSLLQDRKFANHLYAPSADDQVLYPATSVQNLRLWTSVYLSNNSSFASPEDTTAQPITAVENGETSSLQKTRSCENLLCLSDHVPPSPSRRKSDPNISLEMGEQQQKLLKDAILGHDGDTSSSESVKSTDNVTVVENGVASTDCDQDTSLDTNKLQNGHLSNGDVQGEDNMCNGESSDGHELSNGYDNGENYNGHELSNGHDNGESSDGHELSNGHDNGESSDGHELSNGHGHELSNGYDIQTDDNLYPDDSPNTSLQGSGSVQDTGVVAVVNGYTELRDNQKTTDASKELMSEMSQQVEKLEIKNVLHTDPLEIDVNLCNRTSSNSDLLNGGDISPSCSTGVLNSTLNNECSCSVETLTDNVEDGEFPIGAEDSSHTLTPSHSQTNGHTFAVESLKCLCDKSSSLHRLKAIDGNTSISTSTSDLTDSRVELENSLLGKHLLDGVVNVGSYSSVHNNLKLRCILAQTGIVNGAPNGGPTNGTIKLVVNGDASVTPPLYPSPISPQSRNSTCPPTPGTSSEGKSIETPLQRQQTGIGRHLDVDGLTTFNDLVQSQIDKVKGQYETEISSLRDEVSGLRQLLAQHASACNGEASCSLEYKVGVESPGSGDMHSIQSNYSNAASDASWDQMDDPEVKVALWVPDHMVKHCAGCDVEFSLMRRKHHCRNCGKIFCHSCCKDSMPLPHQMVHTPERVCQVCYSKLGSLLSRSVMEFENGISEQPSMAAASN